MYCGQLKWLNSPQEKIRLFVCKKKKILLHMPANEQVHNEEAKLLSPSNCGCVSEGYKGFCAWLCAHTLTHRALQHQPSLIYCDKMNSPQDAHPTANFSSYLLCEWDRNTVSCFPQIPLTWKIQNEFPWKPCRQIWPPIHMFQWGGINANRAARQGEISI